MAPAIFSAFGAPVGMSDINAFPEWQRAYFWHLARRDQSVTNKGRAKIENGVVKGTGLPWTPLQEKTMGVHG